MTKNKNIKYLLEKDYENLLEFNMKLYEYYGSDYGIFSDVQSIAGGIGAGINSAVKGFLNLMSGVSKYRNEIKKIKKVREEIEDYKKELQEFFDLKFEIISRFDEILKKIKEYTKIDHINELEIKEDDAKLLKEFAGNIEENLLKIKRKIKIINEYKNRLEKVKKGYEEYMNRSENPFLEKLKNEIETTLSLILDSELTLRKEFFKKVDELSEIKKMKEFNDWIHSFGKEEKILDIKLKDEKDKEKELKFISQLIVSMQFVMVLKETYGVDEKEFEKIFKDIESESKKVNESDDYDLDSIIKFSENTHKNIEKIKEKETKEESEEQKLLKTLDTDTPKEGIDEKKDLEKLDKVTKSAWEKMSDTDKEAYTKLVKETLTKKKYILRFYVFVYTLLEEKIKKIEEDKLSELIDMINKVLITAAKNKNLKSTFIQIKQQIQNAKNNNKTKTTKVIKEYSLQDVLTQIKTVIVNQNEKNKKDEVLKILEKEKKELLENIKNANDEVKRNPPYLGEEFIKKIDTALEEKLKKDPLITDIIKATDSIK
jgi:hypothetical protein